MNDYNLLFKETDEYDAINYFNKKHSEELLALKTKLGDTYLSSSLKFQG